MRKLTFTIIAAALASSAAAAIVSPEAEWEAAIADENKDYAQIPHAMLKIQDSVYLGEGESAVLQGKMGAPQSWRWNGDPKAAGVLKVSLLHGKLNVTQNGKAVDAAQIQKSIPVDNNVDVAGQPTQVGANIAGWRIFVYDQQNPDAKNFTGVSYFPYDPAFRVSADFVADAKLPPRVFRTSRGTDKQFYHAGDARFMLKGKTVTLPFYAESHDAKAVKDMTAFYRDDLTGKGAYGSGRYVDAEAFGAFPPKTIVIDFNLAYNPNCARSAHFTCPLAIDALPIAMAAGERDPHIAR